ncbi:MAG: EAL domain-containing protein [Lachnospiraceae bacterium]|nr:EAL domain-containing protein [Lachnospiraceae bacterium]
MWDYVVGLLGIRKQDDYVKNYIEGSNMKAIKYMCAFVIFVETWMILRIVKIVFIGGEQRTVEWIVVHLRLYVVLLISSSLMMWFAVTYGKGKKRSHVIVMTWKIIYSIICVVFGIYVSYLDYIKGEQIMGFLTMILFVGCLLVWPPFISLIILSLSFGIFYIMCDNTVPATVATDINMFTTYVAMVMVSIGNFRQRLNEANKDKGLEYVSRHDELTGIYNMYYFRKKAKEYLRESQSLGDTIDLIYFDIVNFKNYNERYGFEAGNELLKEIAQTLKDLFCNGEVARLSDDHFIVLSKEQLPERKIRLLQEKIYSRQRDVFLGLKAGIYRTDGKKKEGGEGLEDINLLCDRALFAVKSIKNKTDIDICYYDEAIYGMQKRKNYIINNIDKAIKEGYIKVYYQPIVEAKTGKVSSLEALARWKDPNLGMLSPGEFIETLEEFRQIHKLDKHILELVCRDYCMGCELNRVVLPVSINLSRLDFELCDISFEINRMLSEYNVPKEYIEIEITESALTKNREDLDKAISEFKNLKYNLWLDDFGAGYSSFNVLKDYAFDVLKIDMKFLEDFGENERFEPIFVSIIELCSKLNMISLAEGVETEEQYDFLKNCGCDRMQGYLFSRPVIMDELQSMFKSGKLEA